MSERTPGPHALSFGTYLALMTVALLLAGNGTYLALYAGLLALFLWLLGQRLRHPGDPQLRRECLFYAVAMNVCFQAMAGAIPATRDKRYDAVLLQIDRDFFGIVPNVWAEQFASPWLTELLSACYLLFMPLLAVYLIRYFFWDKGLLGPFYRGLFTVYGIGFTGYFLVPAAGPYLSYPEMFSLPLIGGPIARFTHSIVVLGSNKVDVFPSLHCAVTAFILGFAYRHQRREFRWLLVPIAGLWISTIYLRYHYVIDVACGFALAALALALISRPAARPLPIPTQRSLP
jgi:membrane-associated phospholipid phosphatase